MARAIFALFAAAFALPALIVALGLDAALGGALRVGIVLFVAVLAMGFPALVTFCKRQWWSFWRIVGGGALGGALCTLPFVGAAVTFHFIYLVIAFALAGTCIAVLFWVAAIWGNRNLTCPKEFCLPCGAVYKFARNALHLPVRG